MKTFLRVLSISALQLASLGANAGESPFFDINQPPQPFDVVLDKVNDYQGELEYSYILDNGDVLRSGKTHCHSSICTIVDLPYAYGSLIKSGAILTLSQNGTVTYAAPHGPEYFNKNKIFSDPFSLGKYVFLELKKEGYKEKELLQKIGTDNIYKLYLTLSKIYKSSQLSVNDVISYIETGGWEIIINNTQNLNSNDELGYLRDILKIGSNIPGLGGYLGPIAATIGELKNFLDGIDKEPEITTNQIYQKLDEIEKKIDSISDGLDRFYDIYATNEIREIAINIHNKYLIVDSFNNQIINTITPSTDIMNYVDNSETNRGKRIRDIATILNAEALRNLNRTSELMLGSQKETSLFQGYASNLLFLIVNKKNSGRIEDYTDAYETYNNWLLQQYFSILFTTSKALYMELSALNLKMKYDADIYPAADYGPVKTSDKYFEKAEYLVNSYRAKIDNLSKLLDSYLVSPDFSFKKAEEANLLYNELNIQQNELVSKEIGKAFTHVVLANHDITAYYTYNNSKRFPNGIIYFIPTITSGDIFEKRCWFGKKGTGIMPGCDRERLYSNCYNDRHNIIKLDLDQKLSNDITPLKPIPDKKYYEDETTINTFYYRNTCSNSNITLKSHEIDDINKRIKQIRKSLP